MNQFNSLLLIMVLLISTHLSANDKSNYDIRQVSPSISIEDAKAKQVLKRNLLVDKWSRKPMNRFPFYDGFQDKALSSVSAAYARILRGVEIDKVNEYLLDERFQPSKVGTRIKLLGGLCKRYGDYDFVLQELIRVAYAGRGLLSTQAYDRLLNDLLTQKGIKHFSHFKLGVCGRKIKDTENHILMTEVARYLTNQLMYDRTGDDQYDNEKNGFNDWLVDHLEHFFKLGFSEINSKPYAGYTIQTLTNIYDYARSKRVKRSAQLLLDYLSMKFALESSKGRRYPTFRRQYRRYLDERLDEADYMSAIMMIWAGQYDYLNHSDINLKSKSLPYGDRIAMNVALSDYRPHDFIYEHLFNNDVESLQFYDFDHEGLQVVYKNPNYTISGGGVHRRMFPPFSMLNDVLAAPTMIIPAKKGRMLSEMIYYLGYNKEKKRSNLCVNKNFMCGFNIHIPEGFKKCESRVGEWSFYNMKDPACSDSPYEGLYLAVYNRNIKHRIHRKTKGKNFGLVEISQANIDFEQFKVSILKNNSKRLKRGKVTYTMSTGVALEVNLDPKKGQYNFDHVENKVKGYDRVRGTFHQMNSEFMTLIAPNGDSETFYYRD